MVADNSDRFEVSDSSCVASLKISLHVDGVVTRSVVG
jgi:hypothetical protein